MAYLIYLIVTPYQRLFVAYRKALAEDRSKAEWRYIYLPMVGFSALGLLGMFTGLSALWGIAAFGLYTPFIWAAGLK